MNYSCILIAAGGGLAIQLLNLMELSNVPKDKRPDLNDGIYRLTFIIFPLISGFVGYVYLASGFDIKPVLALHLGASAPLILRAMASIVPRPMNPVDPKDGA